MEEFGSSRRRVRTRPRVNGGREGGGEHLKKKRSESLHIRFFGSDPASRFLSSLALFGSPPIPCQLFPRQGWGGYVREKKTALNQKRKDDGKEMESATTTTILLFLVYLFLLFSHFWREFRPVPLEIRSSSRTSSYLAASPGGVSSRCAPPFR